MDKPFLRGTWEAIGWLAIWVLAAWLLNPRTALLGFEIAVILFALPWAGLYAFVEYTYTQAKSRKPQVTLSQSEKAQRRKRWLVVLLVVLGVLLACMVTTQLSASQLSKVDDGTNNFNGVKLVAAQNALRVARENEDFADYGIAVWAFSHGAKLRVVEVTRTDAACISQEHLQPSDPAYYDVTVEGVWLYGLTSQQHWHSCLQLYP